MQLACHKSAQLCWHAELEHLCGYGTGAFGSTDLSPYTKSGQHPISII